jgi:sugar lactone lactonase YvrE
MIEQKQKLRLDELQVDSFVTLLNDSVYTVRGGAVYDTEVCDDSDDYSDSYEIGGCYEINGKKKKKRVPPPSGHDGSVCMSANIGTCHH